MSSSNSTTPPSAQAEFFNWKSPVPYLYASLAIILGLISVSLIILACSYRLSSSNSSSQAEEKSSRQVELQVDGEPKVVVIMAGDDNPTCLAKPVSCNFPGERD